MHDGPKAAVPWLQSDLRRFGIQLGASDIVITGTPLALYPVKPRDHIAVVIDGTRVECFIVSLKAQQEAKRTLAHH